MRLSKKGKVKKQKKMVFKKTWGQFRKTGLLFFANQVLHFFGWAIVVEYGSYNKEKDEGDIKNVYPARVKYRGFCEEAVTQGHKKVARYLKEDRKSVV